MRRYKELGIVEVARTGAERYDTVTDAQVGRLLKAMEKDGFHGFLAAPLEAKHELLGVVCLLHRANEAVPEAAVPTLRALSDQVALVVRNIQYNEELARKNEELTHLDELKSDFMATMSHELRTPLTSIIGYSDMLLSGMTGELNEKQSAFVDSILKGGESLLSLINDILDLTKIEAGRLELNREAVDLRAALLGVLPVVKPRAQDKRIRISTFLPTDLPLVWADPGKLNQILLNLITNGIKYTHENGSVSVEARTLDGLVEIWVNDTGIGIAKEDQDKVFQRFTQIDSSATRSQGGTGLGTGHRARARRAARRHHPPAEQTRKGLQLHLHHADINQAGGPAGGGQDQLEEVRSVAKAILVADDDPDILSIVSMSLETQGYTVHKATNGREAVDLAREHHPDLILMDMMMPVVSGYEAVGELKADAATRDIVIVGLSAKAMATDMERATDVGIDGYITKPFRIAQVLSVVESYLTA